MPIIIEQYLQRYLASRTAVTALLGSPARLYAMKPPQSPVYPYATFHRVVTQAVDGLDDGPSATEFARVQFNAWCGNYYTAKNIAETLRLELMGLRGVIAAGVRVLSCSYDMSLDLYDDEATDPSNGSTEGVHHIASDFTFGFTAST